MLQHVMHVLNKGMIGACAKAQAHHCHCLQVTQMEATVVMLVSTAASGDSSRHQPGQLLLAGQDGLGGQLRAKPSAFCCALHGR